MNELQKCKLLQPADCSTADLDDDRIKEYELLLDEKIGEVDNLVQVTDKTRPSIVHSSIVALWSIV